MARDYPGTTSDFLQAGVFTDVDITGLDITIAAWVNPDSVAAAQGIATKWGPTGSNGQYALEVSAGGLVTLGTSNAVNSDFVSGATNIGTGVWKHIAGRQNSGGKTVFVNGVSDGSDAVTRTMVSHSALLTLGKYVTLAAPYDGKMAGVAIWDASLSDGELLALAKGVSPLLIRPGNLKFWAPLFGAGSPERDYSGNAVSMTINGSVPAAATHPWFMPFAASFRVGEYGAPVTGFFDSAEIYLDLQPTSVELAQLVDTAEVYADLQSSGIEELERVDAATVPLDLQASGSDIFSPLIPWWEPLPTGENKWFEAEGNKWSEFTPTRFRLSVRGRL